MIPGMAELAGAIKAFRSDMRRTGRLILQCCPSVVDALREAGGGHPEYIPPPPQPATASAAWRQVEVHPDDGMPLGAWRLLDDGEPVSSGTVAPVRVIDVPVLYRDPEEPA